MRTGLALTLSVCLALLATAASAGAIRGTLWMSADAAKAGGASARAQSGASDAVIYLESIPDKIEYRLANPGFLFFRAPRPHLPCVVQVDRKFDPHVLSIAAGTSVVFFNLDTVYHNAFSVSPAKRFDLGKYPPGKRDTVLFDHEGVVNLHCDIHAAMLGYVVVTPNHAFARPDSLGRYQLPKLPPGTYDLHVFHPRHGELRRSVEMPKRGDLALDLGF